MSIYIATYINGRGLNSVMRFDNRRAFFTYADSVLSMRDTSPRASDSIGTLCDKLQDCGPGTGSRYHRRISARDAKRAGMPIYD